MPLPLPPQPAVLGELRGPTVRLELTTEDALWAARMVVGEEGTGATRAQALVVTSVLLRRWVAVNEARQARGQVLIWDTFEDLLRAFSQPLQARRQIERARRIRAMPWEEISPEVRDAVTDLMEGKAPLALRGTGAINFAARSLVSTRSPDNPDWRVVGSPAANVIVSDATGRALASEPVVVGRGQKKPTTVILLAVALGGGAVAALWRCF